MAVSHAVALLLSPYGRELCLCRCRTLAKLLQDLVQARSAGAPAEQANGSATPSGGRADVSQCLANQCWANTGKGQLSDHVEPAPSLQPHTAQCQPLLDPLSTVPCMQLTAVCAAESGPDW